MATPREHVAGVLKPLLPKGYLFKDHETTLGQLAGRGVVILKQGSIRSLPATPMARLQVDWIITVAVPSTDERQREIDNDHAVLELLAILEDRDDLVWTEATKVLVDDYLGYDITVQTHIKKE